MTVGATTPCATRVGPPPDRVISARQAASQPAIQPTNPLLMTCDLLSLHLVSPYHRAARLINPRIRSERTRHIVHPDRTVACRKLRRVFGAPCPTRLPQRPRDQPHLQKYRRPHRLPSPPAWNPRRLSHLMALSPSPPISSPKLPTLPTPTPPTPLPMSPSNPRPRPRGPGLLQSTTRLRK